MNFYSLAVFTILMHSCKFNSGNAIVDAVANMWHKSYEFLRCPFGECCNEYFIPNNITSIHHLKSFPIYNCKQSLYIAELQQMLRDELFGQHIAMDIVARQIEAHLSNVNPSKPLVMSFHGWTGNGKNHVAYLIAKSLYKSEVNSPFYHHFMATVHFPHQVYSYNHFLRYFYVILCNTGAGKTVSGSSQVVG